MIPLYKFVMWMDDVLTGDDELSCSDRTDNLSNLLHFIIIRITSSNTAKSVSPLERCALV